MGRRLSEETRDKIPEIIKERLSGVSLEDLSKKFNLSVTAIRHHLAKAKKEIPELKDAKKSRKKLDENILAEAKKLLMAGLGINGAAEKLGVKSTTLASWNKRLLKVKLKKHRNRKKIAKNPNFTNTQERIRVEYNKNTNASVREIGSKLGITGQAVHINLMKMGVSLKKQCWQFVFVMVL